MSDYDVVIVGAGHNSLVCSAYLAQAGLRVCVLEKRARIGGAITTEEVFPGYQVDLGGSGHSFIQLTPILQDLQLADYGLDYINIDPLFFCPYPDDSHLFIWRDVDQTCASIAQFSSHDARQYKQFCEDWSPVALAFFDMLMHEPTLGTLFRPLTQGVKFSRLVQLRLSIVQLLNRYFETDQVKAAIGWLAAQGGMSPLQPGSAMVAIWHVLYHHAGLHYPRGGSIQLARALQRFIEQHQGMVKTNAEAAEFVFDQHGVSGVRLTDGTQIAGKIVIAGCHFFTTMQLLGDKAPPAMQRRRKQLKAANGLGLALRMAVSDLPRYRATNSEHTHVGNQLICPSPDYIGQAWRAYAKKQISEHPLSAIATYSYSDSSLAPPNKHLVSVWSQYFPYHLADGQSWATAQDHAVNRVLTTLEQYAPGFRDGIREMKIQTPVDLEDELGLFQGDIQHLQLSPDQMFMFRPGLKLSHHRTPVGNLYLTGASTHPGGGIMGIAGFLTAKRILQDLSIP